jgi:large subunit ribosomal protein L29
MPIPRRKKRMALLKISEIREMSEDLRAEKLNELRDELMHERGIGAMGGAPASPGKIRALRKNIARILTVQREIAIAEGRDEKTKARTRGRTKEAGE